MSESELAWTATSFASPAAAAKLRVCPWLSTVAAPALLGAQAATATVAAPARRRGRRRRGLMPEPTCAAARSFSDLV
jgi:hypothetical protein